MNFGNYIQLHNHNPNKDLDNFHLFKTLPGAGDLAHPIDLRLEVLQAQG